MAHVLNDRVKETTTSTGTGTINLAGAVSNFETFVTGIGDGNTTYYAIVHRTANEFEIGLGTITDATPDTLTGRSNANVISSSNSDNVVDFSAGTKDVFCTLPASKAITLDNSGNIPLGTVTLDSSGNITLDADGGTVTFSDAGSSLGTITSSGYSGNAGTATALATARNIGGVSFNGTGDIDLPGVNTAGNQNTSGTAAVATVATTVTITDNESTDEDNAIVFTSGGDVDGGNLGLESDGNLTYNPSTGTVTATGFSGNLTGTLQTAAQTNVTSLGTLTTLTVDNININGNTIISTDTNGDINLTPNGTGKVNITSTSTSNTFQLTSTSTAASTSAPDFVLYRDNYPSLADGDYLGRIDFLGKNSADQDVVYGAMTTRSVDVTDGTEDGSLNFVTVTGGATLNFGSPDLKIQGGVVTVKNSLSVPQLTHLTGNANDSTITNSLEALERGTNPPHVNRNTIYGSSGYSWVQCGYPIGYYYSNISWSAGSLTGVLHYFPGETSTGVTIDGIGYYTNTANASSHTVYIGIYTRNKFGYPSQRVHLSTFSNGNASTGHKIDTTEFTLTPGWYWVLNTHTNESLYFATNYSNASGGSYYPNTMHGGISYTGSDTAVISGMRYKGVLRGSSVTSLPTDFSSTTSWFFLGTGKLTSIRFKTNYAGE